MQEPEYQVIIYHRYGVEVITGSHEYVVFCRASAIMQGIATSGVKELKKGESNGNPV